MASGSAFKTYHSTLAASTVDTVTLTAWTRYVLVVNKSTTATDIIYVTTDGSAPHDAGDNTFCVPAGTSKLLFNEGVEPEPALGVAGSTVVKLISTGTPAYGVEKN